MSSDEDTPSLDKDKTKEKCLPHTPTAGGGLRHRFRFLRNKAEPEEGYVRVNELSKIYNINAEKVDQVLPTESVEDVESAVDALEDADLKNDSATKTNATTSITSEEVSNFMKCNSVNLF